MYPPSWFNYVYTSGYFGNRQDNSISLPKGVIIAKMESVESILDRLEKVGEFERERIKVFSLHRKERCTGSFLAMQEKYIWWAIKMPYLDGVLQKPCKKWVQILLS